VWRVDLSSVASCLYPCVEFVWRVGSVASWTHALDYMLQNRVWSYVDRNQFFQYTPTNATHGHCYKLFVEQSSCNVRYHFFSRRVVPPLNSLPQDDVDFSTLAKFCRLFTLYK